MSKERPIAYEPHPVSAQRKAQLIKAGYQIVDAIYKPKEAPAASETSGAATAGGGSSVVDLDALTVKELTKMLEDRGVQAPAGAKKADLIVLVQETAPQQ